MKNGGKTVILRYTIQTSHGEYSENCDEEFYETETIEYEPTREELIDALVDITFDLYFNNKNLDKDQCLWVRKAVKSFIIDTDIDPEIYEDELLDYFEKTAKNQ